MKKIVLALLSAIVINSYFTTEVKAETVTVNFSGNLNGVTNGTGILAAAGITNGDILSGSFTYDTSALNQQALYEPEKGYYDLTSYSWNVNNTVFINTASWSGIDSYSNSGWVFSTYFEGTITNAITGYSSFIQGFNSINIPSYSDRIALGLDYTLPTSTLLSQAIDYAEGGKGVHDFNLLSIHPLFDAEVLNVHWSVQSDSVPEPSTYALFGLGAIGMLMVMRRQKSA